MSEYFEHIVLESGIHHIIWLDNSEEASEAYHHFTTELHERLPTTPNTLRILHDYRQVSFHPFLRMIESAKFLQIAYPHITGRIAYLTRDLSLDIMMKTMAQMSQSGNVRRLFKPEQEKEAIQWLLQDSIKEE